LLEAPPEQVIPPACYDVIAQNKDEINTTPGIFLCGELPEWYRPYLRYLLGNAYALDGQPGLARASYYALWNEYPTNLFGVAARLKLKLISPVGP